MWGLMIRRGGAHIEVGSGTGIVCAARKGLIGRTTANRVRHAVVVVVIVAGAIAVRKWVLDPEVVVTASG